MKSVYLYVRESTDAQKRKGYSLPEQEDRLLKYCEYNSIKVEDIYREDYSAKNFNRSEWKKLVETIRKKSPEEERNILFIKWDRFSRNIEYAYEMIGILQKRKSTNKAMNFTDKKITVNRAKRIMAKNGIDVDETEAGIILKFLYLMAKTCNQYGNHHASGNLNR